MLSAASTVYHFLYELPSTMGPIPIHMKLHSIIFLIYTILIYCSVSNPKVIAKGILLADILILNFDLVFDWTDW